MIRRPRKETKALSVERSSEEATRRRQRGGRGQLSSAGACNAIMCKAEEQAADANDFWLELGLTGVQEELWMFVGGCNSWEQERDGGKPVYVTLVPVAKRSSSPALSHSDDAVGSF
nr:unnamed protein product [Digitaria exilis]